MKPYTPNSNCGRAVGGDDIRHRTADQPKGAANAVTKTAKHAARQQAHKLAAGA
jgi:hypothetical protein